MFSVGFGCGWSPSAGEMALLWRQVGRWLCGVDSGSAGVLRKVHSRPETPGEVVRLALWSMEAKQTNGTQENRVGQPRWEGWASLWGSSGPWGSPSPASPASALKLPGLGGLSFGGQACLQLILVPSFFLTSMPPCQRPTREPWFFTADCPWAC